MRLVSFLRSSTSHCSEHIIRKSKKDVTSNIPKNLMPWLRKVYRSQRELFTGQQINTLFDCVLLFEFDACIILLSDFELGLKFFQLLLGFASLYLIDVVLERTIPGQDILQNGIESHSIRV